MVIAPWPDAPNGQFRQLWARPHPLAPDGFPLLGGTGTPKEAHAYVLERLRGML
jgi:hypothetical protein